MWIAVYTWMRNLCVVLSVLAVFVAPKGAQATSSEFEVGKSVGFKDGYAVVYRKVMTARCQPMSLSEQRTDLRYASPSFMEGYRYGFTDGVQAGLRFTSGYPDVCFSTVAFKFLDAFGSKISSSGKHVMKEVARSLHEDKGSVEGAEGASSSGGGTGGSGSVR